MLLTGSSFPHSEYPVLYPDIARLMHNRNSSIPQESSLLRACTGISDSAGDHEHGTREHRNGDGPQGFRDEFSDDHLFRGVRCGFYDPAVVLFLIGKKAREHIRLRHYSSAGKAFQALLGSLEGEIVSSHPRAFLLRCDDVATDTIHFRVGARQSHLSTSKPAAQ